MNIHFQNAHTLHTVNLSSCSKSVLSRGSEGKKIQNGGKGEVKAETKGKQVAQGYIRCDYFIGTHCTIIHRLSFIEMYVVAS